MTLDDLDQTLDT